MSDRVRSGTRATRVMVVAGARLDRELLCRAIAGHADLSVACVAATTFDALSLIETIGPDVVVVDARSHTMNPVVVMDFVERTSRLLPRVVVIGRADRPRWLIRLIEVGVSGFVPTSASAEAWLEAIVRAGRGQRVFEDASLSALVDAVTSAPSASGERRLTERERVVLQMVAKGHSSKEIASSLDLSPRTVECHRANLMQKLDVHNVASLVLFAVREGLVSPFDEGIADASATRGRSSDGASPGWQRRSPASERVEHGSIAQRRGLTA